MKGRMPVCKTPECSDTGVFSVEAFPFRYHRVKI